MVKTFICHSDFKQTWLDRVIQKSVKEHKNLDLQQLMTRQNYYITFSDKVLIQNINLQLIWLITYNNTLYTGIEEVDDPLLRSCSP